MQVLRVLSEYLVNMMLSLFTPSKAFEMDVDQEFKQYKDAIKNVGDGQLTESMRDAMVACWNWLTTAEAQSAAGRAKPMIELFSKPFAEAIDKVLMGAIGKDQSTAMVTGSEQWHGAYEEYREKVKEMVKGKYSTKLPEAEQAREVHKGLSRRLEWVMMDHPTRAVPVYPLLTRNVLPLAAGALKRIENALAEVRFIDVIRSLLTNVPCRLIAG